MLKDSCCYCRLQTARYFFTLEIALKPGKQANIYFFALKKSEQAEIEWYGMVWYTLFKSKKHASPNNTQLVSMEAMFVQT